MFRKIILHNFKSFADIELDLEDNGRRPLNIAMVYGENGAGKTNLIDSVRFLKDSTGTLAEPENPENLLEDMEALTDKNYEPEDAKNMMNALRTIISLTQKSQANAKNDIQSLAQDAICIESEGGMRTKYIFDAKGAKTEYSMDFDEDGRLVREQLRSIIDSRAGCYYCITSDGGSIQSKISESFITDGKFRNEIRDLLKRYWGKHSMMAIMFQQYAVKNAIFMKDSVSAGFVRIRDFIDSITVGYPATMPLLYGHYDMTEGLIRQSDIGSLDLQEKALDLFFTSLSPDIRKVRYERKEVGERIFYSLIFDRMISGKVRSVPYISESSGIKKLVRMMPLLAGSSDGGTVFIDELDSSIHDKTVKELIERISPSVNGQLFFTTHNTQLLETADPRTAFIIRIGQDGFKSISPISRISRTQKNHNNRIRYLNGSLGGIPYVGYIDMQEISSIMKSIHPEAK